MKCRVMKVAAWHIRARILNTTLMAIRQVEVHRRAEGGKPNVLCSVKTASRDMH